MTRLLPLLLLTSSLLAPGYASAALAPSTLEKQAQGLSAEQQLQLDRKLVRDRLKSLGMSERDIEMRLSKLDAQQTHRLARDIEKMQPGGADLGGVLVAVVLVLLIIYLLERI